MNYTVLLMLLQICPFNEIKFFLKYKGKKYTIEVKLIVIYQTQFKVI